MRRLIWWIALLVVPSPAIAAAQVPQSPRPGTVRIIVRDATRLPIPAALVTLTSADAATFRVTTNERGEASFENLRPGAYTGRVDTSGFDALDIAPFTVRAGARITREVELAIAAFADRLDVAPAADDRQLLDAFTSQLTDDQIAALPDDPEELAELLLQLAGADAEIRVDGFDGGTLPPGARIQEVRITYDGGAASGGAPRIEIRTEPGGDRWRNNASVSVRDESLNARNALDRKSVV